MFWDIELVFMVSDLEQCSKPELISIIVELRREFADFKKFHLEQMAEVRQELSAVKQELFETKQELAEVKQELFETKAELAATKVKLALANAELAKYKQPKKDSRNSSLPPSHDFNTPKRTQSLRESGKKKRRAVRP
jgi:septal ring factor EnvC (AmiA/AmiB activator)